LFFNLDVLNEGEIQDHDMGGRIIGCLRTKYANKNVELEPKCTTELIDVIQTSKLDIQLDVKLYQKCKNVLEKNCPGLEKEDCLKLLFQQNKLTDVDCKEQVVRIIKEGQADIHVDQALTIACQADILKYCNDIPIG
jgi:Golgi apparatus protein 1